MKMYKNLKTALAERKEVRSLKLNVPDPELPRVLFDFPNLEEVFIDGSCKNLNITPGSWPKLKVLSIKLYQFNGDSAPLFNLPSLEILKIIETPLKHLLLPLGNLLSPIRSLTIKDCELKELPEEISQLKHLREMNLSGNSLSSLPKSFVSLENLTRLNLDSNSYTIFPSVISSMKKISHLSIDNNLFSEDEKARIQREFHIWPN